MQEYEILKNDYDKLMNRVVQLENTISDLCHAFSQTVSFMENEQQKLYETQKKNNVLEAIIKNTKYELLDELGVEGKFFCPQFRSNEETIRLIVEEGKSLGRFGDGEFSIAFDEERQKFQHLDGKLKKRIWDVLNSPNDNYIIGIAKNYGELSDYNEFTADGIRLYMTEDTRKKHEQILRHDIVYSDAYISRPYIIYRDQTEKTVRYKFDMVRSIWDKKNIAIVEGAQTRLGVGNDLFDNALSVRRIIAPATNSFDRYDDLLYSSKEIAGKVDLFILAIGPSSGILAFDLCKEGHQAVDVGHIDLEYEWFLRQEGRRTSVPYKYNNEIYGGDNVEDIDDPDYISQIVVKYI